MKPIVAIVGRPNVGKSMLFNKLIGKRLSIVEDTPGVTRDRIYGETDWNGRSFTLIDTGGIEPRTDDQILAFMRDQARIAIENATVIIFLTDIKTGLTASDQEVANLLLRSGKPIVLAVNKMDSTGSAPDPDFYEFYNLGLGDPIAVSAVHGHGTGDLLDACLRYFPPEEEEGDQPGDILEEGHQAHHQQGQVGRQGQAVGGQGHEGGGVGEVGAHRGASFRGMDILPLYHLFSPWERGKGPDIQKGPLLPEGALWGG